MASLNAKTIRAVDKSAMFPKILEFPDQLKKGWAIGEDTRNPVSFGEIRTVVFSGMGGSAIAGDVLRAVLGTALKVPMVVNRGYTLPPFADETTLFIASSYSGNTEETLSAMAQAARRGCRVIAVSSGGKMGATARTDGFPCYGLPSGYPPRSALGYSLGVLLQAFDAFGVKAVSKQDLHKAAEFLDGESRKFTDLRRKDNPAMAISRLLVGRFPLLVAEEGSMEPVGFRWKCQLNENSKIHASFMPVPEMCHNEIVGWKRLAATQAYYKSLIAVALRSPDEHPRVRLRLNIIQDLVVKNKGKAIDVQVKGATPFERMLYGIHLGDVVSLYLAARNGADPTEIDNIDTLKHKLGQ